ncbi:RING finger protein 4 isoform X1 [Triplophysa dalaica]|uniref:RING finger protein 4 isoform X1 n=1 Tax=Triplophysa dalaica TaxID=1582913 RepID=UPI0024E01758|nr:RING finger protein 4 isoform X1 [Triplophysa dalaica]
MSNTTQRKRRTTSCSRRNNSKRSQNQVSVMETIDVLENENERTNSEDVVDLTCEGLEPAVVDLTNNDSIVVSSEFINLFFHFDVTCFYCTMEFLLMTPLSVFSLACGRKVVEDGVQNRGAQGTESYVLSSDEEEESSLRLSPGLLSSLQASSQARSTPGAVSCPVCMDAYSEIIDSGRLMVSTKCGHLFCSQCIRDSLSRAHSCPTCRKKLTHKQYHPIYI